MRFLSHLITLLVTTLLVACGGGGGSPGESSGSAPATPTAFFTTAPSAGLTLAAGTANTFALGGGTPPYSTTTSNLAIASAAVSGTTISIGGVGGGTASIDVRDSAGAIKTIAVTVTTPSTTPPVSMFTTAPSSVSIANGTTVTYSITGGYPPYSVVSDDISVVRATVSGSVFAVSAVAGGKANVTIKDAQGASSIAIAVTVGSSTKLFINAPSSVTIAPGSSQTYLLSGGTAPYSVVSSNTLVANAGIIGTALTASGLTKGSASLQITDASGSVLSLTVDVSSPVVTPVSQDPVLRAPTLKDALGNSTNSLSSSGNTLLTVMLTDPSGLGIPNQIIDVAGDPTQVIFPEGSSGLTNAFGVATVKVARATLLASGAGSLTITYSYKVGAFTTYPNGTLPPAANKVITTYIGYQLSASNITLSNLDVGIATLAAYSTRQVSVQANINGVPSTGTQVTVNFTATCGQISPATTTTNSSGIAVVSYTATDVVGSPVSTLGCSGKTVEISASTVGATVVTKTLNITSAPATNLSFVSAIPTRIYLDGAGGPTQSIVEFKLVNSRGEPILGQDVSMTLKTLNGGIPKASIGAVGSLAAVRGTTDANGKVSVPVFSGTVPTSVLVNAALVSNPLIQTDSASLTIASGRPAQARVSLAVKERAIRGFNLDGGETTVTLSLADRQGNPVPDGTAVNFVTEGGVMIPPVCTTGGVPGDSQCTVKIRTQNPRPANGLVSILAYAAGEEDFVDSNFNNVYDCGEAFTDLGIAYRDDTQIATGSGAPGAVNPFITGEFSVPRTASPSTCGAGILPTPQVGDGVWGAADVRMQTTIVFSTDAVALASPTWSTAADAQWSNAQVTTQLILSIQDGNGNSVPSGSTIAVAASDTTQKLPTDGVGLTPAIGTCAVTGQSHVAVPNSLSPLLLSVSLKECVNGDQVRVTVTTPAGVFAGNFTVP